MDINVTGIWEHNITGTGVIVAVIDDGKSGVFFGLRCLENKRRQFWFCCHMLSGNGQVRPYLE